MGDFNHGNIKWDTLQSTGVEDSMFLCLVQDNFLTQHVLEPTRAARVLDIGAGINDGQTMDKPWTNDGQLMDKRLES